MGMLLKSNVKFNENYIDTLRTNFNKNFLIWFQC